MKFTKAYFVKEITVQDPDTGGNVQLEVYKHENGGMFAMDASYLENKEDDGNMVMNDPFKGELDVSIVLVELFDKS